MVFTIGGGGYRDGEEEEGQGRKEERKMGIGKEAYMVTKPKSVLSGLLQIKIEVLWCTVSKGFGAKNSRTENKTHLLYTLHVSSSPGSGSHAERVALFIPHFKGTIMISKDNSLPALVPSSYLFGDRGHRVIKKY